MEEVKLTQYSHGAGCGCKISPKILDQILSNVKTSGIFPQLLVGNNTKDDAAVMELEDGNCIISTTDFFMPIVNDAYDFGRIASANAISDVYAMGGKPIMAIAILGWPIDKLDPSVAGKVLEGSVSICKEAGIPLAGGHSIDCPEPIFGLAVTGMVKKSNLKKNSMGKAGDLLYLTKPLGVGILSTAQKKGIITEPHALMAKQSMEKLNSIGEKLGALSYVHALTDVTGFGLLGHLSEICEASNTSAEIIFDQVPVIQEVYTYLEQKAIPGGTHRNWASYGDLIEELPEIRKNILADPQTSGGLLITVDPERKEDFENFMRTHSFSLDSFGQLCKRNEKLIYTR
jgi:selenide,water dikinase